MTPNTETQSSSKADTPKLIVAVLNLISATAAFYWFAEQLLVVRVGGLLLAAVIAAAIALTTERGRDFAGFFQESRTEMRKVVWPTRQETLQTSLAVIVMVLIMGVLMWILDALLFWIVRSLTGG